MDTTGRYKIDFREFGDGETTLSWTLDDHFFSALDEQEIEHGQLQATLRVKKKAAGFLLVIHATGIIEIPCDRCLAPMTQPIEDDGERITVPEDRPVLDIAWNLYETIALAIPIAHVHPEGECMEDVSQYLVTDDEPGSDDGESATSTPQPTDSRWDALKGLSFDE